MSQDVCPVCGRFIRSAWPAAAAEACCCGAGDWRAAPPDVSPVELERLLRRRRNAELVVLVFASWCGVSRAMAPEFARAAGQLSAETQTVRMDVAGEPDRAGEMGVLAVPALVVLRGRRQVARRLGAMDADEIVSWVRHALRAANAP